MDETTRSPLEHFVRDYVETSGGLWEEVEPQVYDVLWVDADEPQRLTFDSEALPEHPTAQYLTFGLPLLDAMLSEAQEQGAVAHAFMDTLHLESYGIEQQVSRDVRLPDGVQLVVEQVRPCYVLHTLFWFEATYLSDEKEQTLSTVAVDRYYGRLVRHLEPLDLAQLNEERLWLYPDAPALPLDKAYRLARERVVRTVVAEANQHQRERQTRMERQVQQMEQYFTDMRAEVQERIQKAQAREEETTGLEERIAALERERVIRIDELRRKAVTRVTVQLTSMLHLSIPRLFLHARLEPHDRRQRQGPLPLTLTWDGLTGKTDAVDCPTCGTPTYTLVARARGGYGCPACGGAGRR